MIDKLELNIERDVLNRTPEFYSLVRANRRQKSNYRGYSTMWDFQSFGLSIRYHRGIWEGVGDKIEILDSGALTVAQIVADINRLVRHDPLELAIARADLAADVADYDVAWFRRHVGISRKQSIEERGFQPEGVPYAYRQAQVQTFYIGSRPSLFRFYDKVAECRGAWNRVKNEAGDKTPSFEEVFGFRENQVLTRAEAQIERTALPKDVQVLGGLVSNAVRVNPFELVRLARLPDVSIFDELTPAKRLKVKGLLYDIECMNRSFQEIQREFSREGKDAKQVLEKLLDYLHSSVTPADVPDLFALYQESVRQQLTAANKGDFDDVADCGSPHTAAQCPCRSGSSHEHGSL